MDIILEGVIGSRAYGLATPESDIDTKGIYVAPLDKVLGLDSAKVVSDTKASHDPDVEYHELGKFMNLAMKCNPTVSEILWLSDYTKTSVHGKLLIGNKTAFLNERSVRGSYGEYARAQARRLMRRIDEGDTDHKRARKHGRHTFRLLMQGRELLTSAELRVNVADQRDWLFEMGDLAADDPTKFATLFEKEMILFEEAKSILPEYPNRDVINRLLILIRKWRAGIE